MSEKAALLAIGLALPLLAAPLVLAEQPAGGVPPVVEEVRREVTKKNGDAGAPQQEQVRP